MKTKTIIRTILFLMAFSTLQMANAQQTVFEDALHNLRYTRESRDDAQERKQQIEQQLAARKAQIKILKNEFSEEVTWWTNGRVCYGLMLDDSEERKTPRLKLFPAYTNAELKIDANEGTTFADRKEKQNQKQYIFLPDRKGNFLLQEEKGYTLQLAQAGSWKLLVIRNSQGRAVEVFTESTTGDQFYQYPLTITRRDMHDVYDGLYQTATGEYVIFGLRECYDVKTYNTDPGCFFGIPVATDDKAYTDRISYGGGRVSRGDPSSEKYQQQMPGGGGAGALMDAMVWALRPTVEGIDVKILSDELFVDHSPRLKETESLKHLASPYGNEVSGQWAFASVRPVTRGMLYRFSKDILRLMRNEIYARHGHQFPTAPDLQRHFTAQTWYQPLKNPTPLTPIEQLNVQIIQVEENSR